MKKLLVAAVLAAAVSGAALAGSSDYVYLAYGGAKERLNTGDLGVASVCSAKQRAAAMFNLEMKKFDLVKSGRRLNADKTLGGDSVYNGNTLEVKPVSHSWQCT